MAPTERTANSVPSLTAKSNAGNNADVILWADPATHALLISGTIAAGSLSNNNAAPGANNQGVLPAIASAAAQSYTEGNQVLLSTDLSGALRVTGSLSIGGTTDNSAYVAGTSTGTPAMGFYHSTVDSVTDGRAATVAITVKRAQHVALFDATGNALLGQKTTANSIPVALASDATLAVTNAGTFAVQSTPVAQADTFMLGGVNIKEINAVTPLMGNGVTGTGSLRVTIASDNTAFSVNATLSAETTKVIGTVRQLGNAGAILDGVITAATAPANGIMGLGVYNSTEPTLTTGQSAGIQLDSKGRQRGVIMDAAGNTRGANVDANNNLGVVLAAETTKVIGTVNIAAAQTIATVTTVSTVTAVTAITNALPAGTNLMGKVGIDQTTPGTTNGVALAHIGSTAVATGNGVVGAGVQRQAVSSDNSAIALWGHGATAASVPANIVYQGKRGTTALPTAVSDGQSAGAMADKFGRAVSLISTIRDLVGTQTTTISASTSETTVVTAGGAGIFNDLIMLVVSNTSSATNTRIDFRDTTAGSVLFSLQSNGGQPPIGFALATPIPQTGANTNWTAQCATSTTDIRVYAVFAKNK